MQEPFIKTIPFPETARNDLITLKRQTKIEGQNIIARIGFLVSLNEGTPPSPVPFGVNSSFQMRWETFAGELSDVLILMLKTRLVQEGVQPTQDTLQLQFRLHLYRGIGYLRAYNNVEKIMQLFENAAGDEGTAISTNESVI